MAFSTNPGKNMKDIIHDVLLLIGIITAAYAVLLFIINLQA